MAPPRRTIDARDAALQRLAASVGLSSNRTESPVGIIALDTVASAAADIHKRIAQLQDQHATANMQRSEELDALYVHTHTHIHMLGANNSTGSGMQKRCMIYYSLVLQQEFLYLYHKMFVMHTNS